MKLNCFNNSFKWYWKKGIKTIYCLGDIIAKGVYPSECLTLLRNKCEVIIRGNCDELMCYPYENCEDIERELYVKELTEGKYRDKKKNIKIF